MEKKNVFVRYFKPFGLKQICDILMVLGAALLIAGLFTAIGSVSAAYIVLDIGLGVYIVASAIAVLRAVFVLVDKTVNHRSPQYKRAVVNVVVMSVIFAIAVFGLLYSLLA